MKQLRSRWQNVWETLKRKRVAQLARWCSRTLVATNALNSLLLLLCRSNLIEKSPAINLHILIYQAPTLSFSFLSDQPCNCRSTSHYPSFRAIANHLFTPPTDPSIRRLYALYDLSPSYTHCSLHCPGTFEKRVSWKRIYRTEPLAEQRGTTRGEEETTKKKMNGRVRGEEEEEAEVDDEEQEEQEDYDMDDKEEDEDEDEDEDEEEEEEEEEEGNASSGPS
ncbi:hypothetical protein K0M31_005482 [Melipona bicolor]|uniref:Uncharacterized protein n=1 Tax=Melipona bicolor TaxID=60889 RepID=A0AA40FVD6_9HYME|nr:hypothetical protein K0M31_005482 [Melipona bicolor]